MHGRKHVEARGHASRGRLASRRHLILLALVLCCGFGLRLWNAETARIHDDEVHYTGDASWLGSPLSSAEKLRFLRAHPREHSRLAPSGALERWGQGGRARRLGHPTLYAVLLAPIVAGLHLEQPEAIVRAGRILNVFFDSCTIAVLVLLCLGIGCSWGAALAAASLYAVFPPAVVYGSLAYLDPLVALTVLAVLCAVVRAGDRARSWTTVGILTGLAVSAKQTGLIAVLAVPVIAVAQRGWRGRQLAGWAVVTLVVACVFCDPVAYIHELLQPSDPFAEIRLNPFNTFVSNVALLSEPSGWYWLSFARHGQPLAPVFARLHRLLTPPVLLLFVVSFAVAIAGRRRAALLVVYWPVVATLCLLPPSDGAWRAQVLFPLVCAGTVSQLASLSRPVRVPLLLGAGLLALVPLAPARLDRRGRVDLADLLFANPQISQVPRLYAPLRGHGVDISLAKGESISRRLWLAPGRYEIDVDASGWTVVTLDGAPIYSGRSGKATFEADCHVCAMEVSPVGASTLHSLAFHPSQH
jgi:hypothetical protein